MAYTIHLITETLLRNATSNQSFGFGELNVQDVKPPTEGQIFKETDVEPLVEALDNCGRSLGPNLSDNGLAVVLQVLLSSEGCVSQQRGLYLIFETLCQLDEAELRRKAMDPLLVDLTDTFMDSTVCRDTRKWAGILALALVYPGREAAESLLRARRDNMLPLRQIWLDRSDRRLRQIACTLAMRLTFYGGEHDLMFGDSIDTNTSNQLSTQRFMGLTWSRYLEVYLQSHDEQREGRNAHDLTISVQGVVYEKSQHWVCEEINIAVTISRSLEVTVEDRSHQQSLAEIEVPFENIASLHRLKVIEEAPEISGMWIQVHVRSNLKKNAKIRDFTEFNLLFSSKTDVARFENAIQAHVSDHFASTVQGDYKRSHSSEPYDLDADQEELEKLDREQVLEQDLFDGTLPLHEYRRLVKEQAREEGDSENTRSEPEKDTGLRMQDSQHQNEPVSMPLEAPSSPQNVLESTKSLSSAAMPQSSRSHSNTAADRLENGSQTLSNSDSGAIAQDVKHRADDGEREELSTVNRKNHQNDAKEKSINESITAQTTSTPIMTRTHSSSSDGKLQANSNRSIETLPPPRVLREQGQSPSIQEHRGANHPDVSRECGEAKIKAKTRAKKNSHNVVRQRLQEAKSRVSKSKDSHLDARDEQKAPSTEDNLGSTHKRSLSAAQTQTAAEKGAAAKSSRRSSRNSDAEMYDFRDVHEAENVGTERDSEFSRHSDPKQASHTENRRNMDPISATLIELYGDDVQRARLHDSQRWNPHTARMTHIDVSDKAKKQSVRRVSFEHNGLDEIKHPNSRSRKRKMSEDRKPHPMSEIASIARKQARVRVQTAATQETPQNPDRKARIIGFSSLGPRNQGTIRSSKSENLGTFILETIEQAPSVESKKANYPASETNQTVKEDDDFIYLEEDPMLKPELRFVPPRNPSASIDKSQKRNKTLHLSSEKYGPTKRKLFAGKYKRDARTRSGVGLISLENYSSYGTTPKLKEHSPALSSSSFGPGFESSPSDEIRHRGQNRPRAAVQHNLSGAENDRMMSEQPSPPNPFEQAKRTTISPVLSFSKSPEAKVVNQLGNARITPVEERVSSQQDKSTRDDMLLSLFSDLADQQRNMLTTIESMQKCLKEEGGD